MRIECPQCQELFEVESAIVDGARVHFSCQHCSESIEVQATRPAAKQARAVASESQTCPKCSSPVDGAAACGSCGLAAERFGSYEAGESDRDHQLTEAWNRLEEDWESDDAHEAFVHQLAGSGDYRSGAGHYRAAAGLPERAERCQQMLQRIQSMATAALLSSKPKLVVEEEPFKRVVVLLMVLILLGAAGGIYFMFKGTLNAGPEHRTPAVESK